jgi:hypothetical protein
MDEKPVLIAIQAAIQANRNDGLLDNDETVLGRISFQVPLHGYNHARSQDKPIGDKLDIGFHL